MRNDICGGHDHFNRRSALKLIGLSGLSWLTPMGELSALASEKSATPAKSLIMLWLDGGNSQLETFDPHAGTAIAQGTEAINTNVKGIQLARGMEQIAEYMDSLSIVRNVVTKEGDHERANYNVKTGFRPAPALVHPAIGAVLTHQLPVETTEIPRHVSILSSNWPARGGYLGQQFDAFQTGDPDGPIPDVRKRVSEKRFANRLNSLNVLDNEFSRGRRIDLEAATQSKASVQQAVTMMSSEQLNAFDISNATAAERKMFGDSKFGRGCLAAGRLVDVGVRCVEVTLGGWDTAHVSNRSVHEGLVPKLDAALAGLIGYLKQRELLDQTIVMCCGEFGRTPSLNPAAGRDHWPHGFSIALAGGGIHGGRIIGESDPEGGRVAFEQGTPVEDVHATVMHAMGIDYALELDTPINRPMKLSEGQPIDKLLSS